MTCRLTWGDRWWHVDTVPPDRMSLSRPHSPAFVACNDAPLVDEPRSNARGASRRKVARRANVRRTSSVRAPPSRTWIERREGLPAGDSRLVAPFASDQEPNRVALTGLVDALLTVRTSHAPARRCGVANPIGGQR